MTDDPNDLRHEAEQMGLTKLSDEHLTQFVKAKAAAQRMVAGIRRDLHMYDEPAHTFRANEEA